MKNEKGKANCNDSKWYFVIAISCDITSGDGKKWTQTLSVKPNLSQRCVALIDDLSVVRRRGRDDVAAAYSCRRNFGIGKGGVV